MEQTIESEVQSIVESPIKETKRKKRKNPDSTPTKPHQPISPQETPLESRTETSLDQLELKKTYFSIFRDIVRYALAVDVSTQLETLGKVLELKKIIETQVLESGGDPNAIKVEFSESQCPLCNLFFKDDVIAPHLTDCLNNYYLQFSNSRKRRYERLEGTEIEINLKNECSFACLPYSSKKRKAISIELEDGSIKLCRFQHLKSPSTWIGICNACEKRKPKIFHEPKTCSYLGHTQASSGIVIKHFSKQKKKIKIELPFCSYQCFMMWILSRQQKQWERACREGDPGLLDIKGESYPTKSFATIKKEVSEMTTNVIQADQFSEEN